MVNEEGFGRHWLGHYAPMLVAFVLAGSIGAGVFLSLIPAPREAWTLVIETNDKIPALQLAGVAEAVFRSRAVYGPALRTLHIHESPKAYLAAHTDLRPVADSNT